MLKNFVLFLEIPVFAVTTKVDKCGLSEQELEDKKTEICEAIGIASDKVLMCSNYQPNQPLDTNKDISILEFLTKVLILWFISINQPILFYQLNHIQDFKKNSITKKNLIDKILQFIVNNFPLSSCKLLPFIIVVCFSCAIPVSRLLHYRRWNVRNRSLNQSPPLFLLPLHPKMNLLLV